jgi:hypothetical protein
MDTKRLEAEIGYAGETELETAENLMYRDAPLTPKMISTLMHVDASIQNTYYHAEEEERRNNGGALYVIGVLLGALVLAALIGFAFLYAHELGPFYDPSTAEAMF